MIGSAVAAVLIIAGSAFLVIGAVGLLRFPDFFTRTHAVGVLDSLGAGLVLIGLMFHEGLSLVTVKLVLILVFMLVTGPAATHALAKAALHGRLEPWTAPGAEKDPIEHLIEFVLLVFMVATAVAVVRLASLFAAAMLFGIYSLLLAALFVVLDAVDVAFTEAAVGAGVSTILMLATMSLTSARQRRATRIKALPALASASVALLLMYAVADQPAFGSADAPAHRHVAPRYLEQGPIEVGVPNVVTEVLASYRGYDTLGEVVVIFTAGVGVLGLLGARRERRRIQPPSEV